MKINPFVVFETFVLEVVQQFWWISKNGYFAKFPIAGSALTDTNQSSLKKLSVGNLFVASSDALLSTLPPSPIAVNFL